LVGNVEPCFKVTHLLDFFFFGHWEQAQWSCVSICICEATWDALFVFGGAEEREELARVSGKRISKGGNLSYTVMASSLPFSLDSHACTYDIQESTFVRGECVGKRLPT